MSNDKATSSASQLDELEASLAGTLKRVTPRRDFVRRLRGTIHLPPRDEIATRLRDWQRLFLVFSGVVSGTLLLITIARALYHLFGRRNG
ncbi:MAG TPA: hypothetical protein VLX61_17795 [Anaerolineales bacterium]|nr:hypothetical protein [Anaerolineales bacterium]